MDAVAVQWPAVRDATASVTGYEVQWTLPHRAGDEGAWRRGCAVGQIDGVGFRALLSALSAEQLDDLRDALRAPRCTVDGLPLHARVVLRARTHSLAGRGPWGGHLGAETLGPRPCASITDQRRIWAGTFSNELQTCSADCWGQVRAMPLPSRLATPARRRACLLASSAPTPPSFPARAGAGAAHNEWCVLTPRSEPLRARRAAVPPRSRNVPCTACKAWRCLGSARAALAPPLRAPSRSATRRVRGAQRLAAAATAPRRAAGLSSASAPAARCRATFCERVILRQACACTHTDIVGGAGPDGATRSASCVHCPALSSVLRGICTYHDPKALMIRS